MSWRPQGHVLPCRPALPHGVGGGTQGPVQRLSLRQRCLPAPTAMGALVFVSCSVARTPQMSGVARLLPCPSFLHGRVQPGLALPPQGREGSARARAPPTATDPAQPGRGTRPCPALPVQAGHGSLSASQCPGSLLAALQGGPAWPQELIPQLARVPQRQWQDFIRLHTWARQPRLTRAARAAQAARAHARPPGGACWEHAGQVLDRCFTRPLTLGQERAQRPPGRHGLEPGQPAEHAERPRLQRGHQRPAGRESARLPPPHAPPPPGPDSLPPSCSCSAPP